MRRLIASLLLLVGPCESQVNLRVQGPVDHLPTYVFEVSLRSPK